VFSFCNVSPFGGLSSSHALGSIFIVQEFCCVWEIKFQSNSFSHLKFEFD
jgi:hypothetical protein